MKQEKIFYFYLDDKLVQYKVIFLSKIKSKIYVKVPSNNVDYDYEVRAPFNIKKENIENVIKSNLLKLNKIKIKKEFNKFINIKYKKIMYLGQVYNLYILENQKSNKVKVDNNDFVVFVKENNNPEKIIYNFFKKQAKKIIPFLVAQKARECNAQYSIINIRKLNKAWGNCKWKRKELTFSYKLMHFNIDIINYVICHEIAHLFVPNHSRMFWNLVGNICPNYKNLKNLLKEFII